MSEEKKAVARKIWWFLLTVGGIYYFYRNFERIGASPNVIDSVITLSLLILVFMPLVSEITAFGMSIKKEMSETKEEMKKEVSSIRNEILTLAISNNNNNNFKVEFQQGHPPTAEEVEETLKQKGQSVQSSTPVAIEQSEDTTTGKYEATEEQVFLYKTRYALEKMMENIGDKYGVTKISSPGRAAAIYRHQMLITKDAEDMISKVVSICNRGIHGEIVDKKYIDYIRVVMGEIEEELKKEVPKPKSNRHYFACSKCNFNGFVHSEVTNQCPNCGFVSDEY